jgi:chemotaxis protein methyltransferase CheR
MPDRRMPGWISCAKDVSAWKKILLMGISVTDKDYNLFITAIKQASDYDFSDYSDKSFKRRIAKILSDNSTDINSLIIGIRKDKDFLEKIVRDITVNTTELFRDPLMWQHLRYNVLPKLAGLSTINIWHAGCSTGQEVYSMLILLKEEGLYDKARVLATDINSEVLSVAAAGRYKYRFNIGYLDNFDKVIKENPLNYEEFRDVPYSEYFDLDEKRDILAIKPFLLEKPVFRKHDLVNGKTVNPAKFDLIICRNVIIYFNYSLQNRIFELFYKNLHKGGFLMLGMHETIMGTIATGFVKSGQVYCKSGDISL